MKILLLTNKSPWPAKDGGSCATLSMIRGLSAKGASVTVLSFNTLKHHVAINDIPPDIADFHLVNIDSDIKPVPLLINLFFSRSPYTLTRFRSKELANKLESILRDGFDIVQAEGLAMAGYIPVIRKNTRSSVIFRPHNVENLIWAALAAEEKNLLKKLYFHITAMKTWLIERKIANSFDAVAAITLKDKEWFTKNGCSKPVIVSSPSPPEVDATNDTHIPMSVAFIGSLDWRPNINGLKWLVKKVWPVVSENLPEATLFVAGRNPGRAIKSLCSGKNIIFAGETPSSVKFLADKCLMAVPLFSGSGIRMKILEGMSLGKPIVATPLAAEGIIYEERKDIFIESDPIGFAERIIELLLDEKLRNETGLKAQENVRKNYDILASAEELMKFYTRLA